jgi:hypothetical protein
MVCSRVNLAFLPYTHTVFGGSTGMENADFILLVLLDVFWTTPCLLEF